MIINCRGMEGWLVENMERFSITAAYLKEGQTLLAEDNLVSNNFLKFSFMSYLDRMF